MKKVLCLVLFLVTIIVFTSCQQAETISNTPSTQTDQQSSQIDDNTTVDDNFQTDPAIDPDAWAYINDIIRQSDEQNLPIKNTFIALIKNITVKDNGSVKEYVIEYDSVEVDTSGNVEHLYDNKEEKIEQITLSEYVVVLSDPYNHFKPITMDALKNGIDERSKNDNNICPYFFYSIGDEVVMLVEMMLP